MSDLEHCVLHRFCLRYLYFFHNKQLYQPRPDEDMLQYILLVPTVLDLTNWEMYVDNMPQDGKNYHKLRTFTETRQVKVYYVEIFNLKLVHNRSHFSATESYFNPIGN